MARLVRLEAIGPVKIDPTTIPLGIDGKPKKIAVCACGLSSTFPICDGSHKQLNERPGQLYRYDPVTKAVIDVVPEASVGAQAPTSGCGQGNRMIAVLGLSQRRRVR